MIRKSDKLVEATMLALQGKLELKENRIARKSRKTKKSEGIDVNIDDTTTVSVEGNETIVDTEDATVIVSKKEDEFVPETSDDLPIEAPAEEPIVDAPVAPDEDIVEVPADDTVMPEEIVDEPVDTELPTEESKKFESVEIEVSDDGKEVEVTTDNGEEVEVKDETPDEEDGDKKDTEAEIPADDEPSIDEMIEESKKLVGSNEVYGKIYKILLDFKDTQSVNGSQGKNNVNMLLSDLKALCDKLIESKKLEKINKSNADINNAIANPQLKANREKIRQAGYETDKKSVTNPRNGRTFQTKYAPNKDKIDWKNRLEKDKTDYEAIVGPESDKIPNSRKISQRYNTAVYSKADADAYGVKYGPIGECDKVVEDTEEYLQPRYDSRASFYKKAKVVTKDNGDEELYSYGTHVGGVRGGKPYSKGRFSQTTSRHQREFFKQRGVDPKKVDVEEGKQADKNEEEIKAKKCSNCIKHENKARSKKVQEMIARRQKKSEALNKLNTIVARHRKVVEANKLRQTKKVENADINKDLGINNDVPKKEEPVPNTSTKIEEKFSSKTFNEVLTKYYNGKIKAVESVKVTRIARTRQGLKIEAKLLSQSGKAKRHICIEAKKIQTGKAFDKYEILETKGLIKENKLNDTKITMTTYTNKQNVIECRYILTK